MNKFLNFILNITTLCFLTSCYEIQTTNKYSNDFRQGYAKSNPIYLSIKDDKNSRIYLLLEKNMNNDNYYIKVNWQYKNNVRQFKQEGSTASFFIDNELIISQKPIKPVRTVSINIDTNRLTQEAVYKIDRKIMTKISNAKYVEIQIDGKFENKVAYFNKLHTFKAFKDFLDNS